MEFQPYWIMPDSTWDMRLKAFDPNLRLVFDQLTKRWKIIENALDGDGVNIVLTLEDCEGNAQPFGEWIFGALRDFRNKAYEAKRNLDQFLLGEENEAQRQRSEMERKCDEIGDYFAKHEKREYGKIMNLLRGDPVSDISAGFRKITPKPRGIIYAME